MNKITDNLDEILGTVLHESDGLCAVEMHIEAGKTIGKHTHPYSHLSIVGKGYATVNAGGVFTDYGPGQCVFIPANVEHEVFAKTDVIWFCIQATENLDI